MKNECDIIKDLLFSYNDGVLSKTSKDFVEKHLKTCKDCNNVFKEIKYETEEKNEKEEIDIFKSVKKKITKKNIIIFVGLIILLLIIIFNILVFKNYNETASTMEVFLQDDITEEQLENIKSTITENTENIELEYVSKEDALMEVKEWDKEVSNFLDEYTDEGSNPMFASFRIKTSSSSDIDKIVETIKEKPGIRQISTYTSFNPYELFCREMISN